MQDGNEKRLADLLEQAQALMVDLSGHCAGADRDWDKAQRLLDGARQVDAILATLRGEAAPAKSGGSIRPRKLPYYYVEDNRLVKVGQSRDRGTYEHRVTREHYDVIQSRLCQMADDSSVFETQRLVDRCDVPRHEPLIVVNMLAEQRLLVNVRRGHWSFADKDAFRSEVARVWSGLPRASTVTRNASRGAL